MTFRRSSLGPAATDLTGRRRETRPIVCSKRLHSLGHSLSGASVMPANLPDETDIVGRHLKQYIIIYGLTQTTEEGGGRLRLDLSMILPMAAPPGTSEPFDPRYEACVQGPLATRSANCFPAAAPETKHSPFVRPIVDVFRKITWRVFDSRTWLRGSTCSRIATLTRAPLTACQMSDGNTPPLGILWTSGDLQLPLTKALSPSTVDCIVGKSLISVLCSTIP